MKKADIGVGIGLLVLSIWLFWYSGRYRDVAVHVYGPDLFPRILSLFMFFLATGLIINACLGRALQKDDRIDSRGFLRVLVSIGICVGYLFLAQILGFASSTCLFLFVMMTLLRQKNIWIRAIASLSTSLIVWSIFRYFLVIPLPEGLLM